MSSNGSSLYTVWILKINVFLWLFSILTKGNLLKQGWNGIMEISIMFFVVKIKQTICFLSARFANLSWVTFNMLSTLVLWLIIQDLWALGCPSLVRKRRCWWQWALPLFVGLFGNTQWHLYLRKMTSDHFALIDRVWLLANLLVYLTNKAGKVKETEPGVKLPKGWEMKFIMLHTGDVKGSFVSSVAVPAKNLG